MKPRPSILLPAALAAALTLVLGGCNRANEPSASTAPTTSIGTVIDDSVLTARVKAGLLSDSDVKSFDIKAETRKGEVQLSGFVDNQAQIERAIAVVRAIDGVTGVDSKVAIKGAPTTVGNKVDDSIVTTLVKAALVSDEAVKSSDIAVVTRKGVVQLSGFVDSQHQMDRAILVARAIEGVGRIDNEMSLKK